MLDLLAIIGLFAVYIWLMLVIARFCGFNDLRDDE